MDDTAITLEDAIKQVDEWLAATDKGCLIHGGTRADKFYDMYVSKWAAYKDVAVLLSKIAVKESV